MNLSLGGAVLVIWFLFIWGWGARTFIDGISEQFRHFSVETIIFSVFSLFWMMFGVLAILWFLWQGFGSQILARQENNLIVTSKIGPVKNHSDKTFNLENISNVRAEERAVNIKGISGKESMIVFDYAGQKHYLLHFLSKEQAETLLAGPLKTLLNTEQ